MQQANSDDYLINGRCLVIPGAQKAGTTAVFSLLSQHPDLAKPLQKEPQVLSLRSPLSRAAGKWYADVMNPSPDRLSLDASTSYLMSPSVIERIEQLIEDPRILIMIRDPARRAFSAYMELKKRETNLEQRTFASIIVALEQAAGADIRDREIQLLHRAMANNSVDLSYTDTGYHQRELAAPEFSSEFEIPEWPFTYFSGSIYSAAVERFETRLPGRVKIVIFEEFVQNPQSAMSEILDFVGLNDFDVPTDRIARYKTVVPTGRLGRVVHQSKIVRKLQGIRFLGPGLARLLRRCFYEEPKLSVDDYNRARSLLHLEYEYWFERLPATRSLWV